jgi:glycine/D-amino acid oxidase-like deaminating enzyme
MISPAASLDSCYWQASRALRPAAPAVEGAVNVDVAVIGGGYTGLSTAYHLKVADPGLDIAVLEAETAGFGASGRNAGFVMTLFGSSVGLMKLLHGKKRIREAHDFMVDAIHSLEEMISENGIDCDYQRSGFLRVATTPSYASRIRHELDFFQSLGINGLEWVDRPWLDARVRSPGFLGACWEPGCGSLNPMKWLEALRELASARGAKLYEGTRVTKVRRQAGRYVLTTPRGTVTADKIVYATNGYTHLIPGMRSRQTPAFTYIIVTDPLTPEQLATIGWAGRETIEDGRSFMHFYRLLPDRRLLVGGGPGHVPFAGGMNHDSSPKAWSHLEHFIGETFPALRGIRIAHRWGGAFSMTSNFTPQVGTLDGGGVIYSVGCTGHGVALTQMNGRIIRDLVLGQKTELTDLWFVNQRTIPMPPEPVLSLVTKSVATAMAIDDWWCDRGQVRG